MSANTTNVEWQWNIRRVNVARQQDGMANVILSATWTLEAEYIDDMKDHHRQGYADTTKFVSPQSENFIVFDQISPNTVVEWIKSEEGTEKMNYIENKILDKLNILCDTANTATVLVIGND